MPVVIGKARGSCHDMKGRAKWWRARGHPTRVIHLKKGGCSLIIYRQRKNWRGKIT